MSSINLEYFFNLIYRWFTNRSVPEELAQYFGSFIFWARLIGSILSIGFLVGAAILLYRLYKIRTAQIQDLEALHQKTAAVAEEPKNERWQKVLKYFESENSAEWKLAIIEADGILDDMTKKLNYPGENLGERLKSVEPSDFETLQDAWEAHKVRNRIAHEHDFVLTRREAVTTIERYKTVIEEFGYI